jgi:hypothetical protein
VVRRGRLPLIVNMDFNCYGNFLDNFYYVLWMDILFYFGQHGYIYIFGQPTCFMDDKTFLTIYIYIYFGRYKGNFKYILRGF